MAKTPDRIVLCEELLQLNKKHETVFARIEEIKSSLLADATENDKVTIAGLGVVKISAPKDERLEGIKEVLVLEQFRALPAARQEKLRAQGLVTSCEIWKKKYYGSVKPELF